MRPSPALVDPRSRSDHRKTYVADLLTAFAVFFAVSILSGRINRFPFDDEIYTLKSIASSNSVLQVFLKYAEGADVHPPLSYALFSALRHFGFGESGMHFVSFLLTAASLALLHAVALDLVMRRSGHEVAAGTRLAAILLFGLNSLAVSQGDALRWYPLFAFFVALFLAGYILGRSPAVRLASAVPLGLAASTSLLAPLVILPFAAYRYGFERRLRARSDLLFWLLMLAFSVAGIATVLALLPTLSADYDTQVKLSQGLIGSIGINFLGFFGGNSLGASQGWVVIPLAVITVFALVREFDFRNLANPVNLLLLVAYAIVVVVVLGFGKSRSYLYLAPVVSAVLVLFVDRLRESGQAAGYASVTALALVAFVAAIANVGTGIYPFKRNAVVPFPSIIDFIATNRQGPTLVLTTDPTLAWAIAAEPAEAGDCVSYLVEQRCFPPDRGYQSIFVVSGFFDTDNKDDVTAAFARQVQSITAGRQKIATMHAGIDEDSALKSRLSHIPLDRHILTVEEFR